MFCQSCGERVVNEGKFCEHCGKETGIPTEVIKNGSVATVQHISPSKPQNSGVQLQLRQLTKKQKLIGLVIFLVIIIGIGSFQLIQYLNSPQLAAKQYVEALNGGDFEKASEYYQDFMNQNNLTKEMVIKSMEDMAEDTQPPVIRIIEKGKRRDMVLENQGYSEFELLDKNKVFIPVEYDYGNNNKQVNILTLYKSLDEKQWQTSYPYSMGYATVTAPVGTTILVNGEEALKADDSRYFEIGPYLPGKHVIELKFFNDVQPPYSQEIFLPRESHVESPYDTYMVYVETLYGAEILFNGQSLGKEGYAYIDDVLEGTHKVTIKMEGDMVKPLEAEIEVSRDNDYFIFNELEPQEAFTEEIMDIIEGYNNTLINAYVNYDESSEKDPLSNLSQYVTEYRFSDDVYDFYDEVEWKIINSQSYSIVDYYIEIGSETYVTVVTDESWHTREEIREDYYWSFSANGEKSIERKNLLEGTYELTKDNGAWKIEYVNKWSYEDQYLNEYGEWIYY
ncbi:zinc ribbon domain-containing protein [Alkaliphilus serpentinus]|uniref:Zinc-ribbon domain-containing protein n=1 Tax=Alkaliphilus serpentinus TaxID=1482731 RepID=A0A833M753_9FIRM|nr:hypothetical protein [Alkaliphilus serpentinus]KAB3529683.1 hypothetical protein F8153_08775 [Alkaliphilus serpentinus]